MTKPSRGPALEDATEETVYAMGWKDLKCKKIIFNVGTTMPAEPIKRPRHKKVLTPDGRNYFIVKYLLLLSSPTSSSISLPSISTIITARDPSASTKSGKRSVGGIEYLATSLQLLLLMLISSTVHIICATMETTKQRSKISIHLSIVWLTR